jgi:formylglycine-generating enzyme required for sulfatase activity
MPLLQELEQNMVVVPGGCFLMGSASKDADRNEQPVHEVCVDGFSLCRYQVTQGLWKAIMGVNPANFQKGDSYPVEQVSWHDARVFIGKLNTLTGRRYCLPTEAEWEYAARSGGKNERYAGSDSKYAVGCVSGKGLGTTHPVGTKSPNGLGLYDMSGNVWEWCSDWYGGDYYASSPHNNPQGPSFGTYRVVRGGCWEDREQNLRTAARSWFGPNNRYFGVGLRLALRAKDWEGGKGDRANLRPIPFRYIRVRG